MAKRIRKRLDKHEIRENVLRPCKYLGYDRDQIGMHLMGREAFTIAESQFRRAVWLNPFEPTFKEHLAWCLYQQHRYAEALPVIQEAIAIRSMVRLCLAYDHRVLDGALAARFLLQIKKGLENCEGLFSSASEGGSKEDEGHGSKAFGQDAWGFQSE